MLERVQDYEHTDGHFLFFSVGDDDDGRVVADWIDRLSEGETDGIEALFCVSVRDTAGCPELRHYIDGELVESCSGVTDVEDCVNELLGKYEID
jgi:hypothetical protein